MWERRVGRLLPREISAPSAEARNVRSLPDSDRFHDEPLRSCAIGEPQSADAERGRDLGNEVPETVGRKRPYLRINAAARACLDAQEARTLWRAARQRVEPIVRRAWFKYGLQLEPS